MPHHPSSPSCFYVRAGEMSVKQAVDWPKKKKKSNQSHPPQEWDRNHSLQKLIILPFVELATTSSGRFVSLQQLFQKPHSQPQWHIQYILFPPWEHDVTWVISTGTMTRLLLTTYDVLSVWSYFVQVWNVFLHTGHWNGFSLPHFE